MGGVLFNSFCGSFCFGAFVTSLRPIAYSTWCKSAPRVLIFAQDAPSAGLPVHSFGHLHRVLRASDVTDCTVPRLKPR